MEFHIVGSCWPLSRFIVPCSFWCGWPLSFFSLLWHHLNFNFILSHSLLAITFTHITHTHSVSHYHWWRQQWAAEMSGKSKPLVGDFRKENPQKCNPAGQASSTVEHMLARTAGSPWQKYTMALLNWKYGIINLPYLPTSLEAVCGWSKKQHSLWTWWTFSMTT